MRSALRKIVGLHPDNIASRIRLAETASQVGKVDEAVHELSQLAVQLKAQGRADDFVRVAERLLFHRPEDFGVARELAAAYVARRNPRLALVKLQAPLKAAPRDPRNVTLLAEALAQLDPPKAIAVWRELAELHDTAGRHQERDVAMRAALALDPTDGETRELSARWGVSAVSAVKARSAPPPVPVGATGISGARPLPRAEAFPGADRSGPVPGLAGVGISGVSSLSGLNEVGRVLAQADVFVKYGLVERAVDHLRGVLEQVDFFLHQSLFDEARSVLDELAQRFPGDPLIDEKRTAIGRAEKAAAAQTDQGAIPRAAGSGVAAVPTIPHGPVAKLSVSERADPGTHGDLGIAYKQMGLYDAAIAEFKLLQQDRTRAVFALTMIGECVEAKGELGEAVGKYKEALNQSQITVPESSELYYLLGSVFERLGDVREALYFFENLHKRDASFRDVGRRIAALKPAKARQA